MAGPNDRKRVKPRQARSRATVDAIVEATGQVIQTRGIEGTTTVHVAERAGVSVGSLYQYFPDKQALIAAFLERRLGQDLELMASVAARTADARSPVELVRIAAEEHLALIRRHRALYADIAPLLPLLEQTEELQAGLERGVQLAIAHLRARPELHGDRDPELVAFVLFHAIRAAVFRVLQRFPDRLDDPQLEEILVGGAVGFLGLPRETVPSEPLR